MSDEDFGREEGEEPGRGDGETRTSQRASSAEAAASAAKAGSAASQSSTGGLGETETQEKTATREGGVTEMAERMGTEIVASPDTAAPSEPGAAPPDESAQATAPAVDRRKTPRGPRPSLLQEREPVFREAGGYRMRLEPPDLARLRELPGAKGKTDRELGEQFFDGQSPRLIASIAGDVETPAEVRVVVDPYSRQAFLAVGQTIRGIVSF